MECDDIAHGPLECVFTVDEERGLTGASEFSGGILRAEYFLNLDGEEKGTLCIGCSGGVKTTARRNSAASIHNREHRIPGQSVWAASADTPGR